MLEDTFESMDDQEEMEEAAEMEIDRILFEITAGMSRRALQLFLPPSPPQPLNRAASAFEVWKLFLKE